MDISSRDNRTIREYRHLLTDGKYRRKTGRFVLEGARLCEDAVLSQISIETVMYTQRAATQYPTQTAMLCAAAPAFEITESLSEYISDTTAPQGLFCICRIPESRLDVTQLAVSGRYAALESVQDPGNLGAMIRSAEAFGLDGMILSDGCCDPYNPKVLRASMGGVFRLPLCSVSHLDETLCDLTSRGFHTAACVVDADACAIQSVSLGAGCIAVIGNEGNGLTTATAGACFRRVTIPMAGRAESLNASMAAGIVFWEIVREGGERGE